MAIFLKNSDGKSKAYFRLERKQSQEGLIQATPSKQDIKRSRNIKHILYGKQEGKCGGCKIWFEYRNMTIDHIISRNKGGADDDANLQLLCGSCNSIKGDREMAFLIAKLKEQKII